MNASYDRVYYKGEVKDCKELVSLYECYYNEFFRSNKTRFVFNVDIPSNLIFDISKISNEIKKVIKGTKWSIESLFKYPKFSTRD
jgi:hypothetical protein